MFKHILVPLDGSTLAEHALPVAARIARATGGSLLLVQVSPQPIDYSGGWAPMMTGEIIEAEMDGATDYLKAVAASQLLAGIETRTEVSIGLTAQYLIAVTEDHESDLVVLCSHGRTGLTRWALGSVAHSLVHQSAVPVLVLRQDQAIAPSSNGEKARPLCTLVPLDVIIVRKLGVPRYEELAMGAIASGGVRVLNDDVVRTLGISAEDINQVAAHEQPEVERRERLYRGKRPAYEIGGRTVILVDDGMATGATMRAAVAAVRQQQPARIVIAVPVAAAATCEEFAAEVDELVCVLRPEAFFAVGFWYEHFAQTSDEEVRDLLARAAHERAGKPQEPRRAHGTGAMRKKPGSCHQRNTRGSASFSA